MQCLEREYCLFPGTDLTPMKSCRKDVFKEGEPQDTVGYTEHLCFETLLSKSCVFTSLLESNSSRKDLSELPASLLRVTAATEPPWTGPSLREFHGASARREALERLLTQGVSFVLRSRLLPTLSHSHPVPCLDVTCTEPHGHLVIFYLFFLKENVPF